MFNFAYPADCLKVRYVLPPPPPQPNTTPLQPGQPLVWYPWMMPRRNYRFLKSNVNGQKVILTNLQASIAVYNGDVPGSEPVRLPFRQALSSALGEKLITPLSGNAGQKAGLVQLAMKSVLDARVADGNKAQPTTEHIPDWLAARGITTIGAYQAVDMVGTWIADWTNAGYSS